MMSRSWSIIAWVIALLFGGLLVQEARRFLRLEAPRVVDSRSPIVARIPPDPALAGPPREVAQGRGQVLRDSPSPVLTPPPLPYIENDVSPWEGALYGTDWTATKSFDLYADPLEGARVVGMVARGETVHDDTGATHTTQYGIYLVTKDADLGTLSPGLVATIHLKKDSKVFMLNYYGESRARFWADGRFFVNWQYALDEVAELTQPLEREWWVRVTTRGGLKGWFKEPYDKGKHAVH